MQCAILLSSPDPRCFFLPHPPHNVVLSCARSHLFNLLFFHVALFYFLFSFYNFIMKIRVPLFFSIRYLFHYSNPRFESGRRASYISGVRCKSYSFIFACESRRCVLDVLTLSHLSLYTLVFFSSPLLFSSTSSSLFRSSERAWCV